MSRRKTLKLSSPADIRRAISRIANMALNNEIDPKQANTLIYACNAGTITDTGHIILNNFHPAYGELKKLLPGIMGKPDDELRRNFATLVVKKQKQPLEKWEQLFLDILEWELKRRTMITKQWKRKGKVKKNGYFAKWH